MNNVHYWMGRPITELSKDELLEVIDYLVEEMKRLQQDRNRWFRTGDPLKYLMDEVDKND